MPPSPKVAGNRRLGRFFPWTRRQRRTSSSRTTHWKSRDRSRGKLSSCPEVSSDARRFAAAAQFSVYVCGDSEELSKGVAGGSREHRNPASRGIRHQSE